MGFLGLLFSKKKFIKNKSELETDESKISSSHKALLDEYRKLILEIQRPTPIVPTDSIVGWEGEDDETVCLYDFIRRGGRNNGNAVFASVSLPSAFSGEIIGMDASASGVGEPARDTTATVAISENIKKIEARKVKPKDVFDELFRVPDPVTLEGLDDKILVFKMKQSHIKNNALAKKEVIDMVMRLENRKKWDEFKSFYEKFDNTTTEKINALVGKYKLALRTADLFIPAFPKEATLIMEEYITKTVELCGKKPVFYVIAEADKFREEFEPPDNDPILLVQSPFGVFWQILGAWDFEMLLLEQL